ncbi:MAG: class I SAM-dependent methyltransferase [Candidatus Buchananbacteria bacterium]
MENLIDIEQKLIEENLDRPGNLIDLGCAKGDNVIFLKNKGFDVTGVDLSEEMLDISKEKINGLGLDINLIKANICDLNMVADNYFDYVICMFTLMNLKTHELQMKALSEMKRVCKSQGKILLMVHNSDEGKVILGDWFENRFEYRIYTKNEIKDLVEKSGLILDKTQIVGDNKYIFIVCSKA